MTVSVRPATAADVAAMVQLLGAKRAQLEAFEPVMWRVSPQAAQLTAPYLTHQLGQPNVVARVAVDGAQLVGFAVAGVQDAPPVFAPGGKTVIVDDFAVVDGAPGDEAALALLDAIMSEGRAQGAVQLIAIGAAKDARAARWFEAKKLHVASQWWTRTLSH